MDLVVRKMIIWTSVLLFLHVLLNGNPVSSYELASQSSSQTKRVESQPLHRFKSLERVLNRLDGVSATTLPKSEESPSQNSGSFSYKSPNSKWREASEPRDFTSNFDEDELDDDDEDSYEDENDTEVLGDKTTGWSQNNPYRPSYNRARTPATPPTTTTTTTTSTTTTTPAPPPPMSYSQFKWQNFGTRHGMEAFRRQSMTESSSPVPVPAQLLQRHHNHNHHNNNNRNSNHHTNNNNHNQHHHSSSSSNNHGNNNHSGQTSTSTRAQPQNPDTSIREAINHALKVSREGSCKDPKPRVVRVQELYPHPGKTYVPHCTILHQCSDDTGCCRHDVLTCSPKSTQRVELAFYAIAVDSNRGSTVERLQFYNHTECECRDRMDWMMPRDVQVPAASSFHVKSPDEQTIEATTIRQNFNNQVSPVNTRTHQNLVQCKCPSAYTERILTDGSCTCDCFDKQKECLRLKKGRNFFTMQDKWCIQSGRCEVPDCAYGSYINLVGRCPRKREKYGTSLSWHRYNT